MNIHVSASWLWNQCDQLPPAPMAMFPTWNMTDCTLKLWAQVNPSFLKLQLTGIYQPNESSYWSHLYLFGSFSKLASLASLGFFRLKFSCYYTRLKWPILLPSSPNPIGSFFFLRPSSDITSNRSILLREPSLQFCFPWLRKQKPDK